MATLAMYRGDDRSFPFTITEPDGDPVNLTGVTAAFTARFGKLDADPPLIAKTSPTGGIAITDAAAGKLTVSLVPADTTALDVPVVLYWDLQLVDGTGQKRTPVRGRLRVKADITRT